ncbi:MAG: electron transfer flavoprotein subunit beta/FixA family protein [Thermodesulfobacteriota bacterium]|nr:electron transfer flavoprotein subunit beta/FixA family protein [Thermodesulfobacteriota bacterium]
MRIIICIKQICYTYTRTGTDPAENFLAPEDKIYRVNPYDEAAMELALRTKEISGQGEIIALTMGPMIAMSELRRCLAMGADHLFHIDRDSGMDPWLKSLVLARAIKEKEANLILCGKESLDNQSGQVGAFMAHHLGMPFVSAITDLTVLKDKHSARIVRSAGRGMREVIESPLPAVFSVDLGLHEPRLPTYEDKKKAWSIPIQKLNHVEDGAGPKIKTRRVFQARPRPKKVPAPDSRLDPYDRIQQLLMGSRVQKKGVMLEGSPESQVEEIISFLQRNGFLGPETTIKEE